MPSKLLDSGEIQLRIGAIAAAGLGVGYVLSPRAMDDTPPPPRAEERPVPLLEEQVQRREAERIASVDYAAASRAGLVTVDGGGLAVFVSPTHLLTRADALDGRIEVTMSSSDGRTSLARAVALDAATGLALLETQGSRSEEPR